MTIFVSHFCCTTEIVINPNQFFTPCKRVRLFCKNVACKSSDLHGSRVARQVCINAQFYPSFWLAACKCGEKCVRLWLAIDVRLTRRGVRCRPNVKMSRNDENLIRFIQSLGNHYKSVAKSKTISKMKINLRNVR
jgi:hypothetical protein